MKIIFLDIDGVLNSQLYHERTYDPNLEKDISRFDYKCRDIDDKAVSFLNDLIKDTGAKVVVSSSWRRSETIESLTKILQARGFTGEIVGFTPRLGKNTVRGNEIHKWIEDNDKLLGVYYYQFKEYVILDDDSDMLLWQKDNFIKTDGYVGLTPTNVHKATYILNGRYN